MCKVISTFDVGPKIGDHMLYVCEIGLQPRRPTEHVVHDVDMFMQGTLLDR